MAVRDELADDFEAPSTCCTNYEDVTSVIARTMRYINNFPAMTSFVKTSAVELWADSGCFFVSSSCPR